MSDTQDSALEFKGKTLPPLPSIKLEKQKLSDSVYEVISDYIVNGKLKPGQRLREAAVAEAMDVSRTPVREAFARLEMEHLLERDPTGAYLIANWDHELLQELATVRATLESLAVRIVSPKLDIEEYDHLQNLVNQMATAYDRGDYDTLIHLDIAFHSYIWSQTSHTMLIDILNSIKVQVLYFMYLTRHGDEEDYAGMHQRLLDVLMEGSTEQAVRTINEHILDSAAKGILDMKQK